MSMYLKSLGYGQSAFQPYLPEHLSPLPSYLSAHFSSPHPFSFPAFYANAPTPLISVLPLFTTTMVGSYVLGLLTGNVSWVDRMWTFLPTAYTAHFALWPWLSHNGDIYSHNKGRVILMLLLQVTWSARLSYHTARRGIYSFFGEDYRWAIWRKMLPAWLFQLFHLGFIAIIQSFLLVGIALPTHAALIAGPEESHPSSLSLLRMVGLNGMDLLLALITLAVIYIQWTADNQQYSFQCYKSALQDYQKAKAEKEASPSGTSATFDSAEAALASHSTWTQEFSLSSIKWTPSDAARGFLTRGLWAWSRHPNFACEQTFWMLQGCIPLVASGGLVGPGTRAELGMRNPLLGAFCLTILFMASTMFTEHISSGKYPDYKAYQALVGEFTPMATVIKSSWYLLIGKYREKSQRVWGPIGKGKGKKVA